MEITKENKQKLEFSKVLKFFTRSARSEIGAHYINGLEPIGKKEHLLKRQELIKDFSRHLIRYGNIPWLENVQPVDHILGSAKTSSFMNGEELYLIQKLIRLSIRLKEHFLDHKDKFPALLQISGKIRDLSSESEALGVIDEHGRIEDSASPRLRDIRTDLFNNRNLARKTISRLTNDPSISNYLQEKTLIMRNGRMAFSVKQEYINRFPGVVIDRSSSGNTVYMEHKNIIPLNNRIALLISEEKQECDRILSMLTQLVLKRQRAILDAQNAVGLTDLILTVTSVMDKDDWVLPEISDKPEIDIRQMVHPLISNDPVPLDIACGKSFRLLVITGPNTGGKTVVLKTVGLAVVLAWHGLPIPAAEGSVVGDFSNIWLDIGDEQSIEQNLSTFSAHLKKIISILKHSDTKSLILLDELGAGTDPQEGAALGIAILDALRDKRCLSLATTHHNPIKKYAIGTRGVETASMEFDHKSLSPSYKLLMGIPGKSNAILIAGRLGMPKEVLERAREARLGAEQSVEDLISELQEKQRILDVSREELFQDKEELHRMKTRLDCEMESAETRAEEILSKAEEEAEKILVKAKGTARELIKNIEGAAESAAHREMEVQNAEVNEQLLSFFERKKKKDRKNAKKKDKDVNVKKPRAGDLVEIEGTGFKGILSSISPKKVIVTSGPIRMESTPDRIRVLKHEAEKDDSRVSIKISRPQNVPSSIMVRGMTVDEALPTVARYLDQAMRAGYGSVTVIHGRGEGILRREVHNLCSTLDYVLDFHLGGPSEGGYGVTIVTFRK